MTTTPTDQAGEDTAEDPTQVLIAGDAVLLEAIIRQNEHWNTAGIDEKDVSVCFEMAPRCNWSGSFTVGRVNRALRAVRPERVILVAGRWFPTNSTNAAARQDVIDDNGDRVCARPGCKVKMTDRPKNATYCSRRCSDRARRTHQVTENRSHPGRSEARKSAPKPAPGGNVQTPDSDPLTATVGRS